MALLSISLQNCEVKIEVKLEVTSLSPFILFLAIKKLHVALTLVDIVLVEGPHLHLYYPWQAKNRPWPRHWSFLYWLKGHNRF
jgi:hypothetical protein